MSTIKPLLRQYRVVIALLMGAGVAVLPLFLIGQPRVCVPDCLAGAELRFVWMGRWTLAAWVTACLLVEIAGLIATGGKRES